MKTQIISLSIVLLLFLVSCSKDEEGQLTSISSSTELLEELHGSNWKLTGCPDHTYLSINGNDECEYMGFLNFVNSQVYIQNSVTNYLIPHYICFATSNSLTVSIQACENTTWKSLFEWNVISFTDTKLVLDVKVPNIDPGYKQRFTFTKQ